MKEYPESWDEHEKAEAESDQYLKIKDGQSVRFHILSGPLTYREDYFEIGKNEQGKTKKKRIAIPFGSQLPGYKLKVKYLVEVVVLDGSMKGMNKLYSFGKMVAEGLSAVKGAWGSTRIPDIVVSRKGSGINDTEYIVTAAPANKEPLPEVAYDLEQEVGYSKKEDIDKLPPPMTSPKKMDESTLDQLATQEQHKFIGDLTTAKELGMDYVIKTINRKFQKKELDTLNRREASELIDTLKAL